MSLRRLCPAARPSRTLISAAVVAVVLAGAVGAHAQTFGATPAFSWYPTAPTFSGNLSVTSLSTTSIGLQWSAATDDVWLAGYRLYRDGAYVGRTASTGYTFTGLTCGQSYGLGVEAYDWLGKTSTRYTITAGTSACSTADTQPPTVPTGLVVSGITETGISLSWSASTDNVGIAGYTVYLNGSKVGSTPQTSYSFGRLTCGTSYTLAVDAYDAAGNRSSQASVSGSTAACSSGDSTTSGSGWTTVVNDEFTDDDVLPSHWKSYDDFYSSHPYGSATPNCVSPQQVSVSGGYLHLEMQWKTGTCRSWKPVTFTGWWSAAVSLNPKKVPMSDDGRVTIRWRVVNNGVVSHRIIPMRWPGVDIPGQTCGGQPGCGEQDLCEGHSLTGCTSFVHYGYPRNNFISHPYTVDLTQWHTWQFTQVNHALTTTVDGSVAWTCNASTAPPCNSTAVMPTLKRVVLQQECANMSSRCPAQSTGTEDIQVDWIKVENPT